MDPYVATRQQFTDHLVNKRIPANATDEWRSAAEELQPLLRKLAYHDAMRPNLQQTYMTPANSKNRVYFMWDFVGRTLGYLYMIPPDIATERMRTVDRERYSDVLSRNSLTAALILDDKPGMLNELVESAYHGQAGQHPDFGEEILEDARRMFERSRNAGTNGTTSA